MRIKKLSPKTILTVLLEGQIDASEYDSLTTEAKIATGVDAGEEDVSCNHTPTNSVLRTGHFDIGHAMANAQL